MQITDHYPIGWMWGNMVCLILVWWLTRDHIGYVGNGLLHIPTHLKSGVCFKQLQWFSQKVAIKTENQRLKSTFL